MRKQLGILVSLLFLSVSALLWTGCNRCKRDCEIPCEPICEPCKPICPPTCKPVCPEPCRAVAPKPRAPCPPRQEPCCPTPQRGELMPPEGIEPCPPPRVEQMTPPREEINPRQEPMYMRDEPQMYMRDEPQMYMRDESPMPRQDMYMQRGDSMPPQRPESMPSLREDFEGMPSGTEPYQPACPPAFSNPEPYDANLADANIDGYSPDFAAGQGMEFDQPGYGFRSGMEPYQTEGPSEMGMGQFQGSFAGPNSPCPSCPVQCCPKIVPGPCPCPQKPCSPPCPNPCPPKCAAPLKPCKFGPSGECSCNGVTVRARNPRMCMLGDQYPLDLEITACCDVCDVVLTTTLPEGVSYMRSQPEARVEGNILVWPIGHMSRGQTICARILLKCEREGEICTCFCVRANPVAFCALLCAKPVLVCEKCGPEEVSPGEPINYVISVTNIGTTAAQEVVVSDILPEGLEHASGQKTLNYRLGNLEPCQTKRVNVCVTACKRGKFCNTALVSACNANQTSCEFCTCVCVCDVECQKVGPKELPVGQNADYQINVVNTGDKTLHEVVVTDTAPSATSIVAAPGANICGKQAVWKLRELKAGERVSFNITLTTCTPGFFTNSVTLANCEGCNSCCEFGTHWKGRPALDVCVENPDNPICIGESSRFKITVTNKGQEYDSNVNVVANFPPELVPVTTSGASAGQVNGQTVNFAPFPNLAPRQTLEYFITVKSNGRGDLRPKIQVSSDFIKNPITQEESLIVN